MTLLPTCIVRRASKAVAARVVLSWLAGGSLLSAQQRIQAPSWELLLLPNGCIGQLVFKAESGNDTIPFFRSGQHAGPSFYVHTERGDTVARWTPRGGRTFRASLEGVDCVLSYKEHNGAPALEVELTNRRPVPFQPRKAGLKMGIDTYMDRYPEWYGKYFPTLMRNERTHFYGYLQTPRGHVLALVSEQPIASWSTDFNLGYQDPPPHWVMGHRIESLNLDLLNSLPLPRRHPQHLFELRPGETRRWTIAFVRVGALDSLERAVTRVARIPMVYAATTSFRPGEQAEFTVYGRRPDIRITDAGGRVCRPVSLTSRGDTTRVRVTLPRAGLYTVNVSSEGKEAEAILDVRRSWREVIEQARTNVLAYHQKPTSHAESWYGFYTGFIAARYFPRADEDRAISDRFERLFAKLHDTQKMVPLYYASRVQNTSTTIGMLVDKFEAYGDTLDLDRACRLGDWLMDNWQRADGAYHNRGVVYTSVIYVAKSMLELAEAERGVAAEGGRWSAAARRHYDSARRAVDQLVASRGNFETEGEMTFEDGMISCSALQIGMLALTLDDPSDRARYTRAMLDVLDSHDCLTQLRVPDARRRQGTMRYWEAQYDVQLLPNMFNSPHGWSAWRAYATYYAYLLTGDERWLTQTFNAMGAFANLIDPQTGRLRWAFVVDPYVEAEQACSPDTTLTFSDLSFGNPHPRLYDTRRYILGERYVDMVSDWQPVNTQDNDVHEVFKCMGETVLTNAFVVERPDGDFVGYNCRVSRRGRTLVVRPDEPQMTHLHVNVRRDCTVDFSGTKKHVAAGTVDWVF